MANKTKEQLIVANNTSFPNNNAGAITATVLRDFNTNMIDSTVNQGVYTTDSASFDSRIDALSGSVAVDTGSLLVTASFASQNLTFTKGDGSQFSVFIPDDSGSILPSGVVSGSSQIDYPLISNIPAGIVSGSSQLTASYDLRYELSGSSTPLPSGVVSGSSQIDYPQISNIPSGIISSSEQLPSGLVSGSSQVSYTELSNIPSGIVSSSSQIILQDTTGLLSGSRIDGEVALALNSTYAQNTIITGKNLHNTTIGKGTPLYFTGSGASGNLVGVFPADAGDPTRMPAGGVAGESLAVGEEGIVLLNGFINGVDTSLFPSGDEIFVAVGGGYINVAPTGSALIQHLGYVEKSDVNGSGVIQMMGEVRGLPNIQEGYLWVGDSNGVPQAVASSSIQTILPQGVVSGSQQITDLGFVSSSVTGSSLVTASFDNGTRDLTFTKGDSTTFSVTIPDASGSTIDTGSFATTGSNSFVGDQTFPSQSAPNGLVFQTKDNVSNNVNFGFGINQNGDLALSGSNPGNWETNVISIEPTNGNLSFNALDIIYNGDVTANGNYTVTNADGGNRAYEVQTANGTQQYLRIGPVDGNSGNMAMMITGSDASPAEGQKVWGINTGGGVWRNTFFSDVTFADDIIARNNVNISWQGGTTEAGSRQGVNHISESVQVYTGLSSDGMYIVSSSVDERIIEVNPTTATVTIANTITSQIFLNPQTLTGTQTVPTGFNGMLTGDVSNAGTIVIEGGANLVII